MHFMNSYGSSSRKALQKKQYPSSQSSKTLLITRINLRIQTNLASINKRQHSHSSIHNMRVITLKICINLKFVLKKKHLSSISLRLVGQPFSPVNFPRLKLTKGDATIYLDKLLFIMQKIVAIKHYILFYPCNNQCFS